LLPELVEPPRPEVGICSTCRTWSDTDTPVCSNCAETAAALGAPALTLSVATLYRKPTPLRDWLTGYKGSADGTGPADPECMPPVRALAGRFLLDHGQALAERLGGLDGIVVVPSTDRIPPHPFSEVLASLDLDVPLLPWLTRGPGDLGFRRPVPDGYVATAAAEPARVLVADDVYTTGARANSAAHALRTAGITVAGLLGLARRVNTTYPDPRAQAMWNRQSARPFRWSTSPALVD
jgi:hypothetical protein